MKKIIIIFILFLGCQTETTHPKIEQSYFIGRWESKDSANNKYIFEVGDSGKVYINRNWYDMQWKEASQSITLTWFNRSSKYFVFDKGVDSFNLCLTNYKCTAYFKK